MTNFQPHRPTDAEVVAAWAAEALRDGRYNLGKALATIAQQAELAHQRARAGERVANVPFVGHTRNEMPVRDFYDPRTSPRLVAINGAGPTGNGDADLESAAIGVQLEQTAVMRAPDLTPPVPSTSRCVARVTRDGVADECYGVVYWAPGQVGDASTPATTAGWRHVDPAVDGEHTPEVKL